MRIESVELENRILSLASEGSKTCHICEGGVNDKTEHVLLEALKYDEE